MTKHKNLQFVWPKDGHKGRGHRGFLGRLDNIVSGRGPDVFIQRKGSCTPIKPDYWGNWDSYHLQKRHLDELSNNYYGLWNASRGTRRYDPESRRYKHWGIPHDWYQDRLLPGNRANYPRFTESETRRGRRQLNRYGRIDPERMVMTGITMDQGDLDTSMTGSGKTLIERGEPERGISPSKWAKSSSQNAPEGAAGS